MGEGYPLVRRVVGEMAKVPRDVCNPDWQVSCHLGHKEGLNESHLVTVASSCPYVTKFITYFLIL